jgi:hypothetical protein
MVIAKRRTYSSNENRKQVTCMTALVRLPRVISGLVAAAGLTMLGLMVASPSPHVWASTLPTIGIVNAPIGVYWRSQPNWNSAVQRPGYGVYNGDIVQLNCHQAGATMPGTANQLWYKATVVRGRGKGSGWVSDHFLATPWNVPNQPVPGVPSCSSSSGGSQPVNPSPTEMGAAYFSPYPLGQYMPSGGELVIQRSAWTTDTACSNSKMVDVPTYDPNAGRTVTTLAGWSLGRVGPLYYLQGFQSRWQTINYVLMIDPGSYDQLRNGCDWTINANSILYNWLHANPHAHLVILAGASTKDPQHPSYVNGHTYYHRGIQEVYFARIRQDAGVRSRVLVCNYQDNVTRPTNALHEQMFWEFNKYIDQAPLGSCPDGGYPWHP